MCSPLLIREIRFQRFYVVVRRLHRRRRCDFFLRLCALGMRTAGCHHSNKLMFKTIHDVDGYNDN